MGTWCNCVHVCEQISYKIIDTELYENIGQVSTNLKAYVVDGMRNMWQQLNEFARSHTSGQEQLQVTDSDMPLGETECVI